MYAFHELENAIERLRAQNEAVKEEAHQFSATVGEICTFPTGTGIHADQLDPSPSTHPALPPASAPAERDVEPEEPSEFDAELAAAQAAVREAERDEQFIEALIPPACRTTVLSTHRQLLCSDKIYCETCRGWYPRKTCRELNCAKNFRGICSDCTGDVRPGVL